MSQETHRSSRNYGIAQTILLVIYTAIFFLDHTTRLFRRFGWSIAGSVLCGIGLLIMLIAFISIHKVIQIEPEPRTGGQLIQSGIYKYLRHPIYTGILILITGLFLRKPTGPIALASGTVFIFLMIKVRFEERLLAEHYPEYIEYKNRTFGILPVKRRKQA